MLHSSMGLFVLYNEIVEFREILIALIIPRTLIILSVPIIPIIPKTPNNSEAFQRPA